MAAAAAALSRGGQPRRRREWNISSSFYYVTFCVFSREIFFFKKGKTQKAIGTCLATTSISFKDRLCFPLAETYEGKRKGEGEKKNETLVVFNKSVIREDDVAVICESERACVRAVVQCFR